MISFIIPVYNLNRFLRQCLDSAVKQTWQDYEVIVVDDGSSDGSTEICKDYEKRYDFVKCIYKLKNKGLTAAWQSGLEAASGEYIAFLDGDDWVDEEYLERLAEGIALDADVVCCNKALEYSDYQILLKEKVPAGFYDEAEVQSKVFPVLLNDGTYLGRGITSHRCGKLVRTELLKRNLQYCDELIGYAEDLSIMFPVMTECRRLVVLDDPSGLYHYRQNQSSMTRTYKKNMLRQIWILFSKMREVNKDKHIFDFTEQLEAERLCIFMEYIKNEVYSPSKWASCKQVIKAYQKLNAKRAIARGTWKKTDQLLIAQLEKGSVPGLYAWMQAYQLSKKLTKNKDMAYAGSEKRKGTKDSIRVLMAGSDASVRGGMQTVIQQYLNYESWENTKILFVPTFVEKNAIQKALFFGIHFLKIVWICLLKKADLVHLHVSERGSFYRKGMIVKLCHFLKLPVILHHHGAEFMDFYENASEKQKSWIGGIIENAAVNLVLSEYQKQNMLKLFPQAEFRVVYNAVEGTGAVYDPAASDLLFVGRLGQRKGTYDFLEALHQIDAQLSDDVGVYLCGDGETDKVRQEAERLGLTHRIRHIGWCSKEELQSYYKKTMCYVLPSYHEGLPMALLEAMSYGIPCISTAVDAIPEVIQNELSGLLVQPGDVDALSAAILRMADDTEFRLLQSHNGREMIYKKFLLSVRMREMECCYKELKERRTQ